MRGEDCGLKGGKRQEQGEGKKGGSRHFLCCRVRAFVEADYGCDADRVGRSGGGWSGEVFEGAGGVGDIIRADADGLSSGEEELDWEGGDGGKGRGV